MPAGISDQGTASQRRLFHSFFIGGFECSTHRIRTGRRLDVVSSTRHDEVCDRDYERLVAQGIRTAREGLRWHLIEHTPGEYDFSSALPMVRAGHRHHVQILWDLCHYGWPDHLDIWKPEFVTAFAAFAAAFGKWLATQTAEITFVAPVNEISFFSWAGGDSAYLPPRCRNRGFELKAQLVRAAVAAMDSALAANPRIRFLQIDPVINIIAHPNKLHEREAAEGYRLIQYQAWDMFRGTIWPMLGGTPEHLDIIGVNYYPVNQWIHHMEVMRRDHPLYKPFRQILIEVYERYNRPMFIAETGCENEDRPGWFSYICQETEAAMKARVPIHGICLYPVLNHPGWDDDRHCHNGLWDYADASGNRQIYQPLADELHRWREVFDSSTPAPA